MTQDEYNIANIVVTSLNALGTFFAACSALWIASRQTKLQLKENAKIDISLCKKIVTDESILFVNIKNIKWSHPDSLLNDIFIQISIYNIGIKNFTLESIALTSKKSLESLYLSDRMFISKYTQKEILAGNSCSFYIPLHKIISNHYVIDLYRKTKNFKLVINTAMGGVFWADFPSVLHQYLYQESISTESGHQP